ncbi:MAG: hypothetical protein M3O01_01235 [Pseudomonadota bacterium]|nr:hypothetical protein [Pseudomonadota bacterium]
MANDTDWVADVRRWVLSAHRDKTPARTPGPVEEFALGYEAAHPTLQTHPWLESASGGLSEPNPA